MAVGQIQGEVPPGVTMFHPLLESWNGTKWQLAPVAKPPMPAPC